MYWFCDSCYYIFVSICETYQSNIEGQLEIVYYFIDEKLFGGESGVNPRHPVKVGLGFEGSYLCLQ